MLIATYFLVLLTASYLEHNDQSSINFYNMINIYRNSKVHFLWHHVTIFVYTRGRLTFVRRKLNQQVAMRATSQAEQNVIMW